MKTLFFLLVFCYSLSYSQKIDISEVNSNNIIQLLLQQNTNAAPQVATSKTENTQIGNVNKIEVYNRSQKSDMSFSQIGSYNTTLFINTEAVKNVETKVNVTGQNNYIDITGANSISEKLNLNLKMNDKVIFMRNY